MPHRSGPPFPPLARMQVQTCRWVGSTAKGDARLALALRLRPLSVHTHGPSLACAAHNTKALHRARTRGSMTHGRASAGRPAWVTRLPGVAAAPLVWRAFSNSRRALTSNPWDTCRGSKSGVTAAMVLLQAGCSATPTLPWDVDLGTGRGAGGEHGAAPLLSEVFLLANGWIFPILISQPTVTWSPSQAVFRGPAACCSYSTVHCDQWEGRGRGHSGHATPPTVGILFGNDVSER